MTYQEVSFCNSLLASFPFVVEGKSMPAAAATAVLLLQVSYQNKMKELEEFMQEVLKKLKKDGFDDRLQKHNRLLEIESRIKAHDEWEEGQADADGNSVERPAKPSADEIKEADEIRKGEESFDKELSELNTAYLAAYNEKLKEEVPDMKKLSRESFESVVSFIGFFGEVEVTPPGRETVKVPSQDFLKMVGFNIVSAGE